MVVSLGPGKFYGTSLPRPRIYTDVRFNDHRVDPPVPVTDPFMSWAQEAHWSMGGLSFKRLRLQGKIEGNVNKLRTEREKQLSKQNRSPASSARSDLSGSKRAASVSPPPAPVAVKRRRFMDLLDDVDEEEEEEEGEEEEKVMIANRRVRRRLVKKLGGDFDRVASENEGSDVSDRVASKGSGDGSDSIVLTTRSRRSERDDVIKKMVKEVNKSVNQSNPKGKKESGKKQSKNEGEKSPVSKNGVRTSPRLARRGSN